MTRIRHGVPSFTRPDDWRTKAAPDAGAGAGAATSVVADKDSPLLAERHPPFDERTHISLYQPRMCDKPIGGCIPVGADAN
jgi:hypothetical protein